MIFYALSGLINGLTSTIFGLFVYFKHKKNPVNRSYGLLSLGIAVWGYSYFFWQISRNAQEALFWLRWLTVGSIFIPTFFLNFILTFLRIQKERRKTIYFAFLFSVFFSFFYASPLLIKGIGPKLIFKFWPEAGALYSLFLVFFFACVLYACYMLFSAYRKSSGTGYIKNQIKLMLFASLIGFVGGSTNYPLWYNFPFLPVGTILVAVHVLILAYAIVKYRLMDIRLAITRTTIFVMVYTLVLGLPFLLATSGKRALISLIGAQWWLGPLVLMTALGASGPFIFLYIDKKAVALLLREQHRYQDILRHAAVDMTRIRNLQKLLDFIIKLFNDAVRITHSAIYLFDTKAGMFFLKAGFNLQKIQPDSITEKNVLIMWLERHKEPLVYEEIKRKSEDNLGSVFDELTKEMESLNAAVVLPCLLEEKLLDILILGDKVSGKIYTAEDLDNFLELGREVALATENALLYGYIEEEIRQRSRQLIEVESQLVQAEKMATVGTLAGGVAHEINNPLAAILTNAQMLLADASSLDSDTKESLELIEEATKRCRAIVQKLMTYAKKPLEGAYISEVDLSKVINSVISFLGYEFEQDNIKMTASLKEDDYVVLGNQNELEQVVINIVLNARDAIKQVKKSGRIRILLLKEEKWIKIQIEDEGIGMPKDTIPKIFDPFFTTKEVGKGVGLGLSICQSIVEKHNGTISVQSELNKGSCFTIKLPKLRKESVLKNAIR
ncbi:MAG: hypothetical protein AMJ95_13575 [Omnitrophica WOR_2 bacterium SM23_72]|nr:MAG: hypothetical protein AMJ95_13575 [Omnitrophica WOR_2 bacterium SM23_72]